MKRVFAEKELKKLGVETKRTSVNLHIDVLAVTFDKKKSLKIRILSPYETQTHFEGERIEIYWRLENDVDTDLVAFSDISNTKLWLFEAADFRRLARWYRNHRTFKMNFYKDGFIANRYSKYLAENQVNKIFLG